MSLQPFTARQPGAYGERDTILVTDDGTFSHRGGGTATLATIPIPRSDSRFVALVARGRNAATGESFVINIASTFENTGGVVSEVVPDNGDDPPAYRAREDPDVNIDFVIDGEFVDIRFTGVDDATHSITMHLEVL